METTFTSTAQQEFHRLLIWIKAHPNDWHNICDPQNNGLEESYIVKLIEELYQEGLYSIVFYLIYSTRFRPGIDTAAARTIFECLMEIHPDILMERFQANLKSLL